MKEIKIATSPLTGTIYAGTLLKDKFVFGSDKQDVTLDALVAVAKHVHKFGMPIEISKENGMLEFKITVEKF